MHFFWPVKRKMNTPVVGWKIKLLSFFIFSESHGQHKSANNLLKVEFLGYFGLFDFQSMF